MTTFTYNSEEEVIHAALHIMESKTVTGDYFKTVAATSQYFKLRLASLEREVFSVMYLNTQHQMIAAEDVFCGTIDAISIHPREIVKAALLHNAAAVVFSHNHPSGSVEPSSSDRRVTVRLMEALGLVGIRVLDHIIVTQRQTFSFAEEGLL